MKPTAYLEWSLNVDCPHCDVDIDLAGLEFDERYPIAKHIFTNNWDMLRDYKVECPHCKHEFEIKEVVY